jgi:two-component system, sensor histidine kinase LadS
MKGKPERVISLWCGAVKIPTGCRAFGKRVLWQVALSFVFLGAAHAALPVTLPLGDKPSYDISRLEILADPAHGVTVREAALRTDWTRPVPDRVPNLGFTTAAIWVRFSLSNPGETTQKVYVSFEYPVADSVIFYAQGPDGVFAEQRAGDSVPASAHVIPDRHFLFPLWVGPGGTVPVYLRVQSTASMALPIRVLSDQGLSLKAIRDYLAYGILFGFLLLVLVYFITVGACLYERICLWFSLYSLFFGLHTAIRGGFVRFLIPDGWLAIDNVLNLLIIGGLFFTGAKFYRVFLSLKDRPRPFDRIMAGLQYLSIAFVFFSLFPNPFTHLISFLLLVAGPLFSSVLAFHFWRKQIPNAGYFAFGWIVAHMVSVYDFFRILGVLPYSTLCEWSIPFSLLVALVFFSTALIQRNTSDLLMARADPLTGLANRRKFDEALDSEWNRCQRQHIPLTLIMGDVDYFKNFNDAFGHRAGDRLLAQIAAVLRRHARRAGDLAIRYGGEEFALLLPNLDAKNAFHLAERIRTSVERTAWGKGNPGPEDITMSFGVATTIPEKGVKTESLVLEADRKLYEAKRGGRNRTVAMASSGA